MNTSKQRHPISTPIRQQPAPLAAALVLAGLLSACGGSSVCSSVRIARLT